MSRNVGKCEVLETGTFAENAKTRSLSGMWRAWCGVLVMMVCGWYVGLGCSGTIETPQNNNGSQQISPVQKDQLENQWFKLNESSFSAKIQEQKVTISFVIERKDGASANDTPIWIRLRLATLYRVVHDTVEQHITFPQNQKDLTIQMTFPTVPEDFHWSNLGRYVIDYHVSTGTQTLTGFRSLFVMVPQVALRVTGTYTLVVGQPAFLRVYVYDTKTQKPFSNTKVQIFVKETSMFSGKTDEKGQISTNIELPKIWGPGNYPFTVQADTELGTISEQGSWRLQAAKAEDSQILLTTDKPTYQPGQTIHIRTLTMQASVRKPLAHQEQIFEIFDSKNNKLFKQAIKTDAYGVASASFQLAEELNMGTFSITVQSASGGARKTVTVERYRLPKFEVTWTSGVTSLRPGGILKGVLEARYFFGKPVASGKIQINLMNPGNQVVLSKISGTLDEQGKYQLTYEVPRYFPFESGSQVSNLMIEVTVQDTAQQEVSKNFAVIVSQQELWLYLVAESGAKVGLENTFFVFATNPGGVRVPISGEIQWNESALKTPFQTKEHGIAVVKLEIPSSLTNDTLPYKITAKDQQEQVHQTSGSLALKTGAGYINIQTEQSIVAAGKTIQVHLYAASSLQYLALDLRHRAKTLSSHQALLEKGKASVSVTIPADISGVIQLEAYSIHTEPIQSETKMLYVDGNDTLKVEVTLDQSSYKPAQQAQVQFKVTDIQGKPTQAALGIQVVDEAVFARTEFKPEVARMFFNLTEELLKLSATSVGGFQIGDIVKGPAGDTNTQQQREWAARLLLSHVQNNPYDLNFHSETKARESVQKITKQYLLAFAEKILSEFLNWSRREQPGYLRYDEFRKGFEAWAKGQQATWIDPWGRPLQLDASDVTQSHLLSSWGVDEIQGTWDDSSVNLDVYSWYSRQYWGTHNNNTNNTNNNSGWANNNGDWGREAAAMSESVSTMDAGSSRPPDEPGLPPQPSTPSVRLRQDFPETLKFVPSLITDSSGMASLTLDLADSITSWRMTTLASSGTGQIGSALTGIPVFQPFFVDMSLPPTLTRLDEVSVLVPVYNFLPQAQTVQLSLQPDAWFDLLDPAAKTLTLQAHEVKSVSYRIRVQKLWQRKLSVVGVSGSEKDGVVRSVWIEPDGKRQTVSHSGRLNASVQHTLTFPQGIVPESQQIFVKFYPGVASHLIEGLDSMLHQPYGCFEQTSSTTYPNVLVLDYFRTYGKSNREIEEKAQGYIRSGYQRLTAYEVQGGGFSWFGSSPAHIFLTAYGVFEFFDMKKVYPIDEAMLLRTQEWLANKQQSDGSWQAGWGYDHWGGFGRQKLTGTAYVLWSLAATGYKGAVLNNAIAFLRNVLTTNPKQEPYDLALVVNALLYAEPTAKEIPELLKTLDAAKTVEKESCYWSSSAETVMYGQGRYAGIETTALILQAMIKRGEFRNTIACGLHWLQQVKSISGHWGTTQATIQVMRTLIMAANQQTSQVDGTIAIKWGNETIQTITLNQNNQDIMHQVDLSHKAIVGDNTVSIEFTGIGAVMYQLIGSHYLPWPTTSTTGPLAMKVFFDKTSLVVNDTVKVSVTIENTQAAPLQQVVAEIAVPPGFVIHDDTLDSWVKQAVVGRWEKKNEKVVLYLSEISANTKVNLSYTMQSSIPFKGSVPSSRVYLYYNPDIVAITPPFPLEVQ